ncbi:MAG: HDOD domain-containing protein [bacterium]
MATTDPINKETLRRFSRLEDLSNQELDALIGQMHVGQAPKRAELIPLGSEDESTFYLLDGTVRLEAGDGRTKDIKASDDAAKHPISRLRPSRYRVTAITKVKFLRIDNDQLDSVLSVEMPSKLMDSYEVSELLESDSDLSANYLLQIYKDLSQEAPIVPSWHKVSANVVAAVLKEKQDKGRIAHYLMLDPVLAAQVLHFAISTERSKKPLNSIPGAIAILEMHELQKKVFMDLFQESIDPDNPVIIEACRSWWEKSIRVAAVSRELAKRSERFNPDELALGGLLHAIGEAVIIGYAQRFPEFIESGELRSFLSSSGAEVGRVLLTLWGFQHQLVAIIADSADWYRDTGGPVTEVDIVLAARAMVGNAMNQQSIPDIKTLPVYRKLGLVDASANTHAALEHAAQFASDEGIKFLAGIARNR